MDATHTPEEWLPVVGWEGYFEISSRGHVRSVGRLVQAKDGRSWWSEGRELAPYRSSEMGYWTLRLKGDGRTQTLRIHVMVLEAFVGSRPAGLVGLHGDDNVDNNDVSNLSWGTQNKNVRDCVARGRHAESRKTHCARGGHAFTPENTYINPTSGARQCRACVRDLNRRIAAEKRANRLSA